MRRVAELCRGAALLAQGRVCALGLGSGWKRGLGVLPLSLLLLLFVAGQAEEEAEDGFQITIPDLCGLRRGGKCRILRRKRQMRDRRTNMTDESKCEDEG